MIKEIRSQIFRITFVLTMLCVLGVWQYQFVIDAINANVFLNASIFATFGFGVVIVYKYVLELNNEVYAFHALEEDYENVKYLKSEEVEDDFFYYRCQKKVKIFHKPKILAQPYHIISEEIGRTQNLSMTTGVMQNLLDAVDVRLDDRKSLVNYITGLLVFLGLIGTFVGLMVTLGSVGEIIGNLDLSSGAGPEAIQGLMDGLKEPLQGMATGFSSSLFGLVTSLALGMMARFSAQAGNIIKMNFETWLAGVAKVDSATEAEDAFGAEPKHLKLMMQGLHLALNSNAKVNTNINSMANSMGMIASNVAAMAQTQDAQVAAVDILGQSVGQQVTAQIRNVEQLQKLTEIVGRREDVRDLLHTIDGDLNQQNEAFNVVHGALEQLMDAHRSQQAGWNSAMESIPQRAELNGKLEGLEAAQDEQYAGLRATLAEVAAEMNSVQNSVESGTRQTQEQANNSNALYKQIGGELMAVTRELRETARKLEADKKAEQQVKWSGSQASQASSIIDDEQGVAPLPPIVSELMDEAAGNVPRSLREKLKAELDLKDPDPIDEAALDEQEDEGMHQGKSWLNRWFGKRA